MENSGVKTCVHCGQKRPGGYITLKDGTFIQNECLRQVGELHSKISNSNDDPLTLFYAYILSLVMKCSRCMQLIDGVAFKNCSDSVQNPLCSSCGKDKSVKLNCIACQSEIDGTVATTRKLHEMNFCVPCFTAQMPNQQHQEIKEVKEEKKKIKAAYFQNLNMKKNEIENPFLKMDPNCFMEKPQIKKFHKIISSSPPSRRRDSPPPPLRALKKVEHNLSQRILPNMNKLTQSLLIPKRQQVLLKRQIQVQKVERSHSCSMCDSKVQKASIGFRQGDLIMCVGCFSETSTAQLQHLQINEKKEKRMKKEEVNDDIYEHLNALFREVETPIVPVIVKVAKKEQNYNLKQCKICMNADSVMINIECRHLMMCSVCYKQLKTKHNSDNPPCPVCKTVGEYSRYIDPIYT